MTGMRMRTPVRLVLLLTLWTLACATGAAQPRTGTPWRAGVRPAVDPVYAEAVVLPTDSVGLARLDVFAQIQHDALIFTSTDKRTADSAWTAAVGVTIDVVDVGGIIRGTSNDRFALYSRTPSPARSGEAERLHRTFYVLPMTYTVRITTANLATSNEHHIQFAVRVAGLGRSSPLIGSVIPISDTTDIRTPTVLHLSDIGAGLPFARQARLAVSASADSTAQWRFLFSRIDMEHPVQAMDVDMQPFTRLDSACLGRGSGLSRTFDVGLAGRAAGSLFFFTLPTDTLDAGWYTLRVVVSQNGLRDSIEQHVRVFWKDMPRSLKDLDDAISTMRYVLTRDEIDDMNSGSYEERKRKFDAWWKAKDPTPATPFNEAQFEYYSRVDQARTQYYGVGFPDGALTDRGKIHILFGAPESVDRALLPGEPAREIWRYPSLHRTFEFVDRERNGNFRLVQQ